MNISTGQWISVNLIYPTHFHGQMAEQLAVSMIKFILMKKKSHPSSLSRLKVTKKLDMAWYKAENMNGRGTTNDELEQSLGVENGRSAARKMSRAILIYRAAKSSMKLTETVWWSRKRESHFWQENGWREGRGGTKVDDCTWKIFTVAVTSFSFFIG